MHTALSADAGGGGTRLLPRDAYRFARGEQVVSNTGQPVKLSRPLDFYMITEHSDGMGVITDLLSGAPNIMADPVGREFHDAFSAGGETAGKAMFQLTRRFAQGEIPQALNYQPGNPAFRRVWDDIIAAAQEFNDPGRFTTFIAFEWTSLVNGNNLHRNVIFRDGAERAGQMEPYTTTPPIGSANPRDLWAWLAELRGQDRRPGTAIPHNGNLSNGMMFALQDDFADGAPLDRAYAEERAKNGSGSTKSPRSRAMERPTRCSRPTDEFANFETWDLGNLRNPGEDDPGDAARRIRPFRPGARSDAGEQARRQPIQVRHGRRQRHAYRPHHDRQRQLLRQVRPLRAQPRARQPPEQAKHGRDHQAGLRQYITAGLTAVWATENTRGAIFDAMERREVYATTGPRIRVRFFGGWGFEPGDALRRDLALIGYTKGVPMGADLPAPAEGAKAPTFLVYALRDPIGANLDRIQIVKGWLDAEGNPRRRSTTSPGRTIASRTRMASSRRWATPWIFGIPSWTNTIGASELGTVWSDPDFDPRLRAFYYARVIEIPTPRWTAYDRVKFKLDLPKEIPLKTQERAYTSPIWYTP